MLRSDRLRRTTRLLLDAVDAFADVVAAITADYAEPDDLLWQSNSRTTTQLTKTNFSDGLASDSLALPTDDESIRFCLNCTLDGGRSNGGYYNCALLVSHDRLTTLPKCLALIYPRSIHLFVGSETITAAVDIRPADIFRIDVEIRANKMRLAVSTASDSRTVDGGWFGLPAIFNRLYFRTYNCDASADVRRI
jgi:hypothetical protein